MDPQRVHFNMIDLYIGYVYGRPRDLARSVQNVTLLVIRGASIAGEGIL